MSKGFSPLRLIVDWDPTARLWTIRPKQQGLFELSEPYSATWPPSGSMRNGAAWPLRRSALPTPASASSSSLGRLLSTPVASDGGTDRGSSAGWGLRDEARKLLPTPRTSDTNGAGQHGDGGLDLRTAISLLPTPAARDWKSGESNLIGTNARPLNEVVVNLLPTPTASNPNDGESLESWEARRQRNKAKGINGNGQGTPLAIAVRLLPTPVVADARDTANFRPDGTAYSSGYGMTLTDATRLLPTPRASDGEKGEPNQRGSKGDLMLPSAAARLLPTPTAADSERQSSTYGRGDPTLTGAITDPPSAAGSTPSAGPRPGPPTLWDD